jgi:hypothetical protein
LAASDKVILRLSDLVSWITDQVDWMTGLEPAMSLVPTRQIDNNINGAKYQHHRWMQSLHPISLNSGLDFSDIINEKKLIGKSL